MHEHDYKADWLFGNSLVAFIGALLMAQVWEPSEDTFRLLFFFEVPNYTGFIIFLIVAVFFVLSLFLAVASIVPPLRNVALKLATPFSTALDLIVWIAFVGSWGAAIQKLPTDEWWSGILVLGGIVMFFFIPARIYLRLFWRRKTNAKPGDTDG